MIRGKNVIRVAKYKRVSTDEQKLKKNSIIAQDELLDEYISKHPEMVLVGDYSDEGVSGTKLVRTDLQRLLESVERGEVDLILVTKLDRWFRNIAFYYRVQETLEKNKTAWKTILEDYDTLTADGRLKVNIMLSVAQNEAERTSERIKVVFESKIRHRQAVTGAMPAGFTTADGNGARKVVRDPSVENVVYDFLNRVKATGSVRASLLYINDLYGVAWHYNSAYRLLKNTMLYGSYKGVNDYCEPYISKAEFDELQRLIGRNIRKRETNRSYIFSGLLICPNCGRRLSGTYSVTKKGGKEYSYQKYRCPSSKVEKSCSFKKLVSENVIERDMLKQLRPQFEQLVLSVDASGNKTRAPKINKTAIKDEMDRLNKMFQKGRISESDYDQQYEALENKLKPNAQEAHKKDLSSLKSLIDGGLVDLYKTFTNQEKQMFWRSIVDYVDLDPVSFKVKTIHFL